MLKFFSWAGKIILFLIVGSVLLGLIVFLSTKFPAFKLFFVIAVVIAAIVLLVMSNDRRRVADDN